MAKAAAAEDVKGEDGMVVVRVVGMAGARVGVWVSKGGAGREDGDEGVRDCSGDTGSGGRGPGGGRSGQVGR